jgi:UrcA family protein
MNTINHHRRFLFVHIFLVGIAAALPFAALAAELTNELAAELTNELAAELTTELANEAASEPASETTRSLRINNSVIVNFTDLDLNDPAGARTLYARLKMAARKVCGYQPPPVELRDLKEYQDCFDHALSKAVKRVDSQQLYALHAERRKTTVG